MNNEFLEKYTAALNKATELSIKVQKKKVLQVGIDDQLMRDFEEANRLTEIFLSMNK